MCTVSMITDDWDKRHRDLIPTEPYKPVELPPYNIPAVSRKEFDELRKEVLELKELIKAAKKYDKATGQQNCEKPELVRVMRKLMQDLDIDPEDLFDD